jgi:diguanylate cyclase (GGDEF)-like protein
LEKESPARIIVYIGAFLLGYVLLPLYLALHSARPLFNTLFIFYFFNSTVFFYFKKKYGQKRRSLELANQENQEKANLSSQDKSRELADKAALEEKIRRYDSLKKIIEEINQGLTVESIAESLVSLCFAMIAESQGNCVLYLIDQDTQRLKLFKAKKQQRHLIIKEKEGDIFDLWVLRHIVPLIVEDTKSDFRFDLGKIKGQPSRTVSSLIAGPLVSAHKFLGVLRLDSATPGSFSQEDLRFLVTICDIGAPALEKAEYFEQTQELAIHDELTACYTKGYFLERMKQEFRRCVRGKRNLALLMLDIDYFKNYNDKFGHTAGDMVLRKLSQNLFHALNELSPVISRFGGEEFCILLPEVDKKKACAIAESLREKIEKTRILLRRSETNITVSIGVSVFPQDAADENELLLKTDRAMYEAKQKGRNRICCS